jgi:phosphoesterase RecJ-like protein
LPIHFTPIDKQDLTAFPEEIYRKLKKVLGPPFRVTLLTHINPDGDAIGSMLALYWFLLKKGCRVSMAVPNGLPHFLDWMEGVDRILIFSEQEEKVRKELRQADMVFFLDFNDPGRLGKIQPVLEDLDVTRILVDHHPEPEWEADHIFSIPDVSSTAELVYQLIEGLGELALVDTPIATCLYVGIMTDTGCFSFNSSRPRTFEIVAELLLRGIDKDRIFSLIYDHYSVDRIRLLGYSLKEKLIILPALRTAYIALTLDELAHYNHATGDTEGFVNYPFSVKNIRVSALFIEREDHVKISFRSKGDFPINAFAEKFFNGGGHKNAAGGESYEDLDDTLRKFENMIRQYSDEINALP